MVKVYLNLSERQPKYFSSKIALGRYMYGGNNCDGIVSGDGRAELTYVECYQDWELRVCPEGHSIFCEWDDAPELEETYSDNDWEQAIEKFLTYCEDRPEWKEPKRKSILDIK